MSLDLSKYHTEKNNRRFSSKLFWKHFNSLTLEEGKKLRVDVITTVLKKEELIFQDKDFLKKIGCFVYPKKDIPGKHLNKYQTIGNHAFYISQYYSSKSKKQARFNLKGLHDVQTKFENLEITYLNCKKGDLFNGVFDDDPNIIIDFKIKVSRTGLDISKTDKERERRSRLKSVKKDFFNALNEYLDEYNSEENKPNFIEKRSVAKGLSKIIPNSPKWESLYDQYFKRQ